MKYFLISREYNLPFKGPEGPYMDPNALTNLFGQALGLEEPPLKMVPQAPRGPPIKMHLQAFCRDNRHWLGAPYS